MLGCLEDKYFLNYSAWLRDGTNTNMSITYCLKKTGFKSWGQSSSHLFLKLCFKMLAWAGPNGDPIAISSIIEFVVKYKKWFFGC